MAKVSGPLHSLEASGTVGNTLTMLKQRGRQLAKFKSKPGGAPTAAQLAQRARYRAAVDAWNLLDPAGKAAWQDAADAKRITAFNAFLAANIGSAGTLWDAGATTWDGGATSWI